MLLLSTENEQKKKANWSKSATGTSNLHPTTVAGGKKGSVAGGKGGAERSPALNTNGTSTQKMNNNQNHKNGSSKTAAHGDHQAATLKNGKTSGKNGQHRHASTAGTAGERNHGNRKGFLAHGNSSNTTSNGMMSNKPSTANGAASQNSKNQHQKSNKHSALPITDAKTAKRMTEEKLFDDDADYSQKLLIHDEQQVGGKEKGEGDHGNTNPNNQMITLPNLSYVKTSPPQSCHADAQ